MRSVRKWYGRNEKHMYIFDPILFNPTKNNARRRCRRPLIRGHLYLDWIPDEKNEIEM